MLSDTVFLYRVLHKMILKSVSQVLCSYRISKYCIFPFRSRDLYFGEGSQISSVRSLKKQVVFGRMG